MKDEEFALSTREEAKPKFGSDTAVPDRGWTVEPGFYLADRITRDIVAGPFERRFQAQQRLAEEFDPKLCAIVEFTADGCWG